MDHLRERLTVAVRAIETLRELALLSGPTRTERDAAIQRFEYSFEATWKAGQHRGQVRIESVEGRGTTVTVGLPAAQGQTESA